MNSLLLAVSNLIDSGLRGVKFDFVAVVLPEFHLLTELLPERDFILMSEVFTKSYHYELRKTSLNKSVNTRLQIKWEISDVQFFTINIDYRYIWDTLLASLKTYHLLDRVTLVASTNLLRCAYLTFSMTSDLLDSVDSASLVEEWMLTGTPKLTDDAALASLNGIMVRLSSGCSADALERAIDSAAICVLAIRLLQTNQPDDLSYYFTRLSEISDDNIRLAVDSVLRQDDPNRRERGGNIETAHLTTFIQHARQSDPATYKDKIFSRERIHNIPPRSRAWLNPRDASETVEDHGNHQHSSSRTHPRNVRVSERIIALAGGEFLTLAGSRLSESAIHRPERMEEMIDRVICDLHENHRCGSLENRSSLLDVLSSLASLAWRTVGLTDNICFWILAKCQTYFAINSLTGPPNTELGSFMGFLSAASDEGVDKIPPDTTVLALLPINGVLMAGCFSSRSQSYEIHRQYLPFNPMDGSSFELVSGVISSLIGDSDSDVIFLADVALLKLETLSRKSKRSVSVDISWDFLRYRLRDSALDSAARKINIPMRRGAVLSCGDHAGQSRDLCHKLDLSHIHATHKNIPQGEIHYCAKVRFHLIKFH